MPDLTKLYARRMRVVSAPREQYSSEYDKLASNYRHGSLTGCGVGDFVLLRNSMSSERVHAVNLRTNEPVDVSASYLEEISASVQSMSMSQAIDFTYVAAQTPCVGRNCLNHDYNVSDSFNSSEIALAAAEKPEVEYPHLPLDTKRYFRQDYTKLVYYPPKYAAPDPAYPTRHFKLALLGDTNTGKTSLYLRWQFDYFYEAIGATIGVDCFTKHFFEGKFNVSVVLFDTAGQEVYKSITTNCLREADFICFVFSYEDPESFAALPRWIEIAKQANYDFIGVLIGNKYDLFSQINQEAVENMIRVGHFRYFFQVSCSVGYGVHRVLYYLVYEDVKRQYMSGLASSSVDVIADYYDHAAMLKTQAKKGCC